MTQQTPDNRWSNIYDAGPTSGGWRIALDLLQMESVYFADKRHIYLLKSAI